MNRIVISTCLLLYSLLSPAQDLVDSLKKVLTTYSATDTNRCAVLSLLADQAPDDEWQAYNTEMEQLARAGLKKATGHAFRIFYTRILATALNNRGFILESQGKPREALLYYDRSYALNDSIGYDAGMATALSNKAAIYIALNEPEKAFRMHQQSFALSQKNKDIRGMAGSLISIADYYEDIGNIPRALDHYQRSLEYSKVLGDKAMYALALRKTGFIQYGQKEDALARKNWEESLALSKQVGDWHGAAEVLIALGSLYANATDPGKAMATYEEALKIDTTYGFMKGIVIARFNIGHLELVLGKPDKALVHNLEALRLAREIEFIDFESTLLREISKDYFRQKKMTQALDYAQQALAEGRLTQRPNLVYEASKHLAEVYKALGKFHEALLMQELSIQMNDSLVNNNTKNATIHNQYRLEYRDKVVLDSIRAVDEKKLYAATLKQERTSNYLLIVSLVAVLLVAVLIGQRYRHRQKLNVAKLRNKIASDLHDDVGASLSSIKLFAGMAQSDPARAMETGVMGRIEATSLETLETMGDIVWSIHPKNDNFQFVIERMRNFGEGLCASVNLQFDFSTDAGIEKLLLNMEQRKNVFLIYKEAMNNAAKYAGASLIRVAIRHQGKLLELQVSDNGCGIADGRRHQGNGLSNMQQRAGDMGALLTITTAEAQGTTIGLQLKTT